MDEGKIKELIAQLTVKVKSTRTTEEGKTVIEKGTGILLLQNNRAYVLTVHHCVYGGKEPFTESSKEDIKFSFSSEVCSESLNPISIIPLKQNLVLMEIDIDKLDKTDMECHYLDRVYDGKEYYLRGFPNSKVHNFKAECNEKDFDEVTFKIDVYRLTDDTSGEKAIEFIKGLSGGGVFFSENNQLYLVGLTNELRDKYAKFNTVHCTKLVDLNFSDINISDFKTIDDISKRLKKINQEVSEDACAKFEIDNTDEYKNLDRKHLSVYSKRAILEKNFEGIRHYLQGKNSITSISLLDNKFEESFIVFISETLEIIKPFIDTVIESKKEGRDSLILIREKTLMAIQDLNLIQKDRYIASKLQEYIVIGWLLNCNVDFILEDD